MASLRDYFDTDFVHVLKVTHTWNLETSHEKVTVTGQLHLDFDSNTKYLSFYIPECHEPLAVCEALTIQTGRFLNEFAAALECAMRLPGERAIESNELVFSGRIFFYSEASIAEAEFERFRQAALQHNFHVQLRGPEFRDQRSAIERPFAFISHDSRDKDAVARPIAVGLQKLMCPVWFDEFSLRVGDSLRESIEKGLRECRRCILVLSPSFLANTGWTKVEFNSIFTREIVEQQKLVLPIWYGVERSQVFEYSPSLADRVGLDWSLGEVEIIRRLHRVLTDPGVSK